MKKIVLIVVCLCLGSPVAYSSIGVNAGFGIPFITQAGINYTIGQKFSINAGYNNLSLDSGTASVDLTMPELVINWHPFAGSFFVGLGLGSESLEVTATDAQTGGKASAEVSATTTIAKLGWMWGKDNGGFWFGMDVAFISPSGAEVEIKTTNGLGTNSQEYRDAKDAATDFGETSYTNITFARLGYLF